MQSSPVLKARIGNNKVLTLEIQNDTPADVEFAKHFQEAAKSSPATLQEFFTTLHKLEQQTPEEPKIDRQS